MARDNPHCLCSHRWYCNDEQGRCDDCDCVRFVAKPTPTVADLTAKVEALDHLLVLHHDATAMQGLRSGRLCPACSTDEGKRLRGQAQARAAHGGDADARP